MGSINATLAAGVAIAIAVLALVGFIVWRLEAKDPARIAGINVATGVLLGAVPALIYALQV
ncbi:hypothetical protein [Streptomyces bluensis]|uniref:hypothetical protein n=1 Tax=Streptomyces bluensis TaxID=33897 RepID=UPI0033336788